MDPDPQSAPRTGNRILKWLAPLSSALMLAFLIARVSDCRPVDEEPPPVWLATEPPSSDGPQVDAAVIAREHVLSGSKAGTIDVLRIASPRSSDAGVANPTGRDPLSSLGLVMGETLGGSKSGFGGLGLRGPGRADGGVVSDDKREHQAGP